MTFWSFLFAPGFDFTQLWHNLATGEAVRVAADNIRYFGWQKVLQNELAPASWVTPAQTLAADTLIPEALGWCFHVLIGAAMAKGARFSPLRMLLLAFALEVHSFLAVNAAFVNPLNAALDIATYTLGTWLVARGSPPHKTTVAAWLFWLVFFIINRRIAQCQSWIPENIFFIVVLGSALTIAMNAGRRSAARG